ncbi:hypothetical protein M0804_014469 [Polistes exclamans]|nr:hypothetical protein M0804_014469 [Polistes exclamans]
MRSTQQFNLHLWSLKLILLSQHNVQGAQQCDRAVHDTFHKLLILLQLHKITLNPARRTKKCSRKLLVFNEML